MNSFVGVISYDAAKQQSHEYFDRLHAKFPSRFTWLHKIQHNGLLAAGNFEASSLNGVSGRKLFFDGELYNDDEIAGYLGAKTEAFQNNASLVHTLILEHDITAAARLNGQYLIIYIDEEQGKISILNDHAAIQQVFYYAGKNIFLFASDIKFLLAHPQCPMEIDWESSLKRTLPSYTLSSYRNYTAWFKDIYLLPEAGIAEVDIRKQAVALHKYWDGLNDYALPSKDEKRSVADVCEEYMNLLEDAVKIRVKNDQRATSLLSGGLDSSVICAIAGKYKPLDTFSVITQTTVLEETTYACHQLASKKGFNNTQFLVPFHELNFSPELWKQRTWRAESPFNHTDSLTKTLLHYAIREKYPSITNVLTGTGSDQFNGGLARWVVNDEMTMDKSATRFLHEIRDVENRILVKREDESLWQLRHMINRDYLATLSGRNPEYNSWMFYVKSALHIQTYSLLWDEVRASASHHHNTRFPFLDHRFTTFISRIPVHLHKDLFFDKQILRSPAKKILPSNVTQKSKAPSYIPEYFYQFRLFETLTTDDNYALVREALGDLDAPHPVINKKAVLERIRALKIKPDIREWNTVMHIINLGLLEKLGGKNEADLDMEHQIAKPLEIAFDNIPRTKRYLEKKLSIKNTEQLLTQPLCFADDSALLYNSMSGRYYLSKNNILAYEIDDEYIDWLNFLRKIDNNTTASGILASLNITYGIIEEFFRLALKEQILTIKTPVLENA